jgi:hypothetical protein
MELEAGDRKLVVKALAVLIFLAAGSAIANGQGGTSKPNILFILQQMEKNKGDD